MLCLDDCNVLMVVCVDIQHILIGHLINSELSDDKDVLANDRNNFIGQVNNTLSYFRSLD